jgi:hypothetical protein
MSKVLYILILMLGTGFLLRLSVRGERKRKFERKPATPWSALNDDVDPTL